MNTKNFLGKRVRMIRDSKSISIEDLASRSGLDIEEIERIEDQKNPPSLAPLIKIARVLGVRLGTFLDDSDELGPVISRKVNHANRASFSTNNDSGSEKHMDYYALSSSKSGRHMEPFVIQIDPIEEGVDFVVSSHEGEEFIYCLEGVVEITYGENIYLLEEGDSIYYDSIVYHHVHAADQEGAKILAVIYTPV